MGKAVVETLSLEERVAEKLANTIGDMITTDDMIAMVRRGVKKALLTTRTVKTDNWGRTREDPSVVDEAIQIYLKAGMREAVDEWLKENPEAIRAAMDRAIEKGVVGCLQNVIDDRFASIFNVGAQNLQHAGLLPSGAPGI